MNPGPVWRVVDDETAAPVALALDAAKRYFNMAPAYEGPGHRACMIYSAAVCPHLASPHARRKIEVTKPAGTMPKGDRRGDIAAIVGYDDYSYQLIGRGLEIYFGQPVELLQFGDGAELVDELKDEISREPGKIQPCPAYLMDDDAADEKVSIQALPFGPREAGRYPESVNSANSS
jgi:hypothetical protein